MDFVKLKKMQKESREKDYLLSDTEAEKQIFKFISYYDINLDFDIAGALEDDEAFSSQKTKEEKQAGIGIKQILDEIGHYIKMGVIDISTVDEETGRPVGIKIRHDLIEPVGEKSADSEPLKSVVYDSLKPKHTQEMSKLRDEDFTFSQKAEYLMSILSGSGLDIFNRYGFKDKKVARSIGLLLIIAQ